MPAMREIGLVGKRKVHGVLGLGELGRVPSAASRWYLRNAASSASNVTWMGSSETIVVSSVESAEPPLIRLPSVTTRLLTRPLTGAFTSV